MSTDPGPASDELEPIDPNALIPPQPGDLQEEREPIAAPSKPGDAAPPPLIPGRGRTIMVAGFLFLLLAILVFVVKESETPTPLKVGDCFDIPTSATVPNVSHHSCTDAHSAEVFLVTTYTGAGATVPSAPVIDQFVTDTCDPAVTGYVGKPLASMPDLVIGYIYPSQDAWDHGDRTVTCYVARADQQPMATSLRGSANP
jgi:hypothetical protein